MPLSTPESNYSRHSDARGHWNFLGSWMWRCERFQTTIRAISVISGGLNPFGCGDAALCPSVFIRG